jgi:molybdate transport system substrate-binding protein
MKGLERMDKTKKTLAVILTAAMLAAYSSVASANLIITTGAGYKTMVEELSASFREGGGIIEEMYGGHIGQMIEQIKQGSGVNVIISDKGSLDEMSRGVDFDSYEDLGSTLLVLAWRKGLDLKSPDDLVKPDVKSVCHPDTKAAIYGRAAGKFLESSGIGKKIPDKISVVSSVPQVFAYLVSGEMDAGFVNRVMVQNGGEKVGGWIEIEDGYPPLNMVAAVIKGNSQDENVAKFIEFLRGEPARAILRKNGIW